MGRVWDFTKRRIAGYIMFWLLVILLLIVFYSGDGSAQVAWIFVLGTAFIGSLLYTRRMKRRQGERRAVAQQPPAPQPPTC